MVSAPPSPRSSATSSAMCPGARTSSPGGSATTTASAALPGGTTSRRIARPRAQAAMGSTPRTGRNVPSSASSPTKSVPSRAPASTTPAAHSMPTAIGTSKAAPSLRRSAGARLTVIRRGGSLNPLFSSAPRIRTRPSRTPASGSPTMLQPGRPTATSTSTSMAAASIPTTAAEATRANMPRVFASRVPTLRGRRRARYGPLGGRRLVIRPGAGRPGRFQRRRLEREAQAQARVERRLEGDRLAVVRVLVQRRAAHVLGVLQVLRGAVDDGGAAWNV